MIEETETETDTPARLAASLLRLKPHQCRWPSGKGRFCGEPRASGHRSFCEKHAGIARGRPASETDKVATKWEYLKEKRRRADADETN